MFDAEDEAAFRGVLLGAGKAAKEAASSQIQQSGLTSASAGAAHKAINEMNLYTLNDVPELAAKLGEVEKAAPPEEKAKVESAKNKAVAAATAALQTFDRPSDVSCSLSVLPWNTAKDAFGRHFANTLIAIQLTVRNLNKDDEFLLHDVQIAVDTSPGLLNRFQAGINLPIARSIGVTGQVLSVRNFAVRAAEFIGSVASSSSIPAGTSFKDGAAVFVGAFIPAFKTLLPDQTIEQLARIDDLSFSASNNRRIVVGTRQSVTIVTFIPTKPLQRIDFACIYECKSTLISRLALLPLSRVLSSFPSLDHHNLPIQLPICAQRRKTLSHGRRLICSRYKIILTPSSPASMSKKHPRKRLLKHLIVLSGMPKERSISALLKRITFGNFQATSYRSFRILCSKVQLNPPAQAQLPDPSQSVATQNTRT